MTLPSSRMQWSPEWRNATWSALDQPWDIVVIGGGITGAGILREAARQKLKALLVEQRDFSWGTSSRSSKLVHGGLRYLKSGQVGLTRASVAGREQLLDEGAGLVDPLGFLLAEYKDDSMNRLVYGAGLTLYDLMAMQWSHRYYSPLDFQLMAPYITPEGLAGGFHYQDAQTDDARLVLRVIREAVAAGATAINYVRADSLLREDGHVAGVRLVDCAGKEPGPAVEIKARRVVNATGAWADFLRAQVDAPARIRPLRGSHLVFPAWRFPVAQAVSFMHPVDGRPVFAFPWEGVTLVGTTDVDCEVPLDREPTISADEVAYLMAAVTDRFPALDLGLADIISSFAGIRPVIGSGKADPSRESREHVVWEENGLLTVTGGKLTTFAQTARDALAACAHLLDVEDETPEAKEESTKPILDPVAVDLSSARGLDERARQRLIGRYGADAAALVETAGPDELSPIPGTSLLWAEVRWAARAEAVVHLDDLLLRRVRLGLLLPDGGAEALPRVGEIVREEIGWDNERWATEEAAYLALWHSAYSVPPAGVIPDWRSMLAQAETDRETRSVERAQTATARRRWAGAALLAALVLFVAHLISNRRRGEVLV